MPPDSSSPSHGPAATRVALAIVLLGVVLAVAAHLRISTSVIDDAWITWRYSANLANGDGFVYNAGERVLGTTTPAWGLLLGGIGAIVGAEAIPSIARWTNLLLLLAGSALVIRLALDLGASRVVAAVAGTLWLVAPYQLFSSVGGMETPLFGVASVGAILLAGRGRWYGAALVAGASVWVRPEGVFLIAGVLLTAWAARRARPSTTWVSLPALGALALLPGVAMVVWMQLAYGLPVPHSIVAKRAGLYDLTTAESFILVRSGLPASFTFARELGFLGLGPLPVLVLGSVVALRARGRTLALPLGLLAVLFLFFATSRTLPFPHYFALFEPWALLAWGAAAWWVARAVGERLPEPRRHAPLTWAALFVLIQPLLFYPWFSVAAGAPTNRDDAYPRPLFRTVYYEVAAEQIDPVLPDGTRILLPEIGVLGWEFARHHVIDAAGLVSPEAISHLPVADSLRAAADIGAIPPGLVFDSDPDLILTLDLFGRSGLFRNARFQEEWEVVWAWNDPGLAWGPLRAFARRGSVVGARLRELPLGIRAASTPGA